MPISPRRILVAREVKKLDSSHTACKPDVVLKIICANAYKALRKMTST